MLPVIPIACACGFIASALGLSWYESMSGSQQDEADKLAADLAYRLYQTTVQNLTGEQLRIVSSLVSKRLGG